MGCQRFVTQLVKLIAYCVCWLSVMVCYVVRVQHCWLWWLVCRGVLTTQHLVVDCEAEFGVVDLVWTNGDCDLWDLSQSSHTFSPHFFIHRSITQFHHESTADTSFNRFPSDGFLKISKTACFILRSFPILNMWTTHYRHLDRIHSSVSNVCHLDEDSWCSVFPVMILSICELTPFNVLLASSCSCPASDQTWDP